MVDLDALARQAVIPGSLAYQKILDVFGQEMIGSDGGLDRRRLRKKVIQDGESRKKLEKIVHPEITRLMIKEVEGAARSGKQLVFVEVPLLFEAGLEKTFDVIILVVSDPKTRINRLVKRDGISAAEAELLLKTQLSDEMKKKHSDFIIENTGTEAELLEQVAGIRRELQNCLKKHQKPLTGNITLYKSQPG